MGIQWYVNSSDNIQRAKVNAFKAYQTGDSSRLTVLERGFYNQFINLSQSPTQGRTS